MSKTTDTVRLALVLMGEKAGEHIAGSAPVWTAAEIESAVLDAEALQAAQVQLHAIAERDCNGHQTPDGRWDEAAAKRDEAKADKVMGGVRKIADRYQLTIRHNGDPRGSALKIETPRTRRSNEMGGDWAV